MPRIQDQPPLIQVPQNPADWPKWREELIAWRKAALVGYDGSAYAEPEFAWTQTCYCCTKIMVWDEHFLNHATGEYHVDAIVKDGARRFGGYDAIVLWHAYPRIGFDDRNQFDYYAELPGGLPGLRKVVDQFHAHGMRVFVDYNPWDTGTRRTGKTDAEACAELVKAINGDGIFLDTLGEGSGSMRAAADAAKAGIALESELAMPISALHTNHLSWAQWFDSDEAPGVLRNRWFEQRHMMHFIRRWDTSHASEIQLAWMNGAGMLVWENIFGSCRTDGRRRIKRCSDRCCRFSASSRGTLRMASGSRWCPRLAGTFTPASGSSTEYGCGHWQIGSRLPRLARS